VLVAGDLVVLDRHGRLIEDWNHEGHYHINLRLDQMGTYGPAATLAAEDRNFYHHGGVDAGAVLRALWVDVTSRGVKEGGSTITQ
jgi:membrane peptidoglycan carboxypeptidase